MINELTGKEVKNIDNSLVQNFKNQTLPAITNNFATKFNTNVQNIIHTCDITTLHLTATITQLVNSSITQNLKNLNNSSDL